MFVNWTDEDNYQTVMDKLMDQANTNLCSLVDDDGLANFRRTYNHAYLNLLFVRHSDRDRLHRVQSAFINKQLLSYLSPEPISVRCKVSWREDNWGTSEEALTLGADTVWIPRRPDMIQVVFATWGYPPLYALRAAVERYQFEVAISYLRVDLEVFGNCSSYNDEGSMYFLTEDSTVPRTAAGILDAWKALRESRSCEKDGTPWSDYFEAMGSVLVMHGRGR